MEPSNNIRNFCIISHVDHGKSTLADRMLELTGTIPPRRMREQVLDQMELERERGITIKMAPVRMRWRPQEHSSLEHGALNVEGKEQNSKNQAPRFSDSVYTLNLIDTPGHIDFSYEVSRALKAVEGAVLLVDATQGVQAQTLTTLRMAQDAGLVIIPVVNKIDAPLARTREVKDEIVSLLGVAHGEILETSGKTGAGVAELLNTIIERVPPPQKGSEGKEHFRSLIFDFQYSNHQGVVVYGRVFDGEVARGDTLRFCASGQPFTVNEVGIFHPDMQPVDKLSCGSIGYIVTGIKEPGIASVGDTLVSQKGREGALPGYQAPKPVVWASLYPESQDDFASLRQALLRLRLSDSSFTFEEEQSGSLGRGFRCGFLGMLHLEIITERIRREFSLALVVTLPSVTYEVVYPDGRHEVIYTPIHFPDYAPNYSILEPWVSIEIIMPYDYLGPCMGLLHAHEGTVTDTDVFGDSRVRVIASVPLRELMRNFFDEIKSMSSGFASLSYTFLEMRPADVVRLDILIADEVVPAFSRVVARRRVEEEARATVDRLHELLPRQQFVAKIQGKALGRIIASETLKAFRKDVTAKLYGGDVTRKMKLLEKQKKGKKKMREYGKVNIPHEVFLKMMRA